MEVAEGPGFECRSFQSRFGTVLRMSMDMRLLSILALAAAIPAHAQTTKSAYLADVTSSVMKASATGRSYQISVALPEGYSKQHAPYRVFSTRRMPTSSSALSWKTARVFAEVPGLVIVGIGYPDSPQGFAWVPRALDLTVTPDPKAAGTNGGAPEFLRFIRNDLVPYIEHTYNVSQDRAWFGHSFGGLFGVYALLNNDGLFGRFIIGSPSFRQGSQIISAAEKAFAATGKPLAAKVFFSVGLLEQPGNGPGRGMVSDLRAFMRDARSAALQTPGISGSLFRGRDSSFRHPGNHRQRPSLCVFVLAGEGVARSRLAAAQICA